jgi:CysZ protein
VTRALRDFVSGIGLFLHGLRLVLGNRRLLLRSALPPLLTSVLLFTALVLLAFNADNLVSWVTPFADGWADTWRELFRAVVGVSVVVAAIAGSILIFSGLTLAIGGPFYESIAEAVEDELPGGPPPAQHLGFARTAWVGSRDTVATVALAVLWAIMLFVVEFVPVVGQTAGPVIGVCVDSWLLAVELTAIPFLRRGYDLAVRRQALRRNRPLTLGFAVPVYLLCLIPLAALIVLPAAMAGGTLLAHRLSPELDGAEPGRSLPG